MAEQSPLGDLHWRLAGPFRGGRALAVAGIPDQPERFFFGSVGGGVWETENAGRTWRPIFDNVPVASVGSISVAPSNPDVIYVGTGEADMRSDIQQGSGIYKSIDGGKTWSFIGLKDSRQIGKIIVDPKDPDTVYAAALGHQYGPNTERGVFKSTDGGKTWVKSLYLNQDTGAINLAMDPNDPNTIYASMLQTRRPPWNVYPPSNGPSSGLYKTTDAGATWKQVSGHGFPSHTGRIGVAISKANSARIYAIVDHSNPKSGGVYRSDDGGENWQHTDVEPRIWGRGWYFSEIEADPANPDSVYVMNTSTYKSNDCGKSFKPIKGAPGGDDYHTMWISPNDPNRMILGSDQGVVVSVDGAKSWSSWYNQPTGQFYHVDTDNRFPYWIYGSQQDSGAMAVPSRTIHTGISAMDTRPIDVGGESGTIAPDPLHPGLLIGNNGVREQLETAWEQGIDPTFQNPQEEWRSTWTLPIVVSPQNPKVFYTSHQRVFRTNDGGITWKLISPDLTRTKNFVPPNLDATTAADGDGKPRRGVVYWLSPSPVKAGMLWAGTDDGLIWKTPDEGKHWINETPKQLGPWSKVGIIEASHVDSMTAYAAVDRHRLDDNHPYIYRTSDGGKSWKLIVNGLPNNVWINVVKEDPKRAGLLYAGSDRGVFTSLDNGVHWQSLQLNLPAASVRDIVFGGDDVVVGTHGRAIWILDDVSTLRQLKKPITTPVATLFRPSPAVIFQRSGTFGFGMFDEGTPFPPEEPQGSNPAWGAVFDYVVPSGAKSVEFKILNRKGEDIRDLSSKSPAEHFNLDQLDIPAYWVHPAQPPAATPGAHRYLWDFRTKTGLLVPPGEYTLVMRIGDQTLSQPWIVKRDPRLPVTDNDLRAQYGFAVAIRDELQVIQAAIERSNRIMAKLPKGSHRRKQIESVLGMETNAPGSLHNIQTQIGGLFGTVNSAPAAPIPQHVERFRRLRQIAHRVIGRIES